MTNIFFNYCDIQFIYLFIFCLFVFLTNRSYGTLSTGFVYRPEKAALLLEGGNQEFYKLKNTVKNHMTLAGGQLHFEALKVGKNAGAVLYRYGLLQI